MLFCFSLVGRLVVHAFLFIIFNISILETAGGCHFVDVCERCSVLPQMFIWLQVRKMSAFKTFKLTLRAYNLGFLYWVLNGL